MITLAYAYVFATILKKDNVDIVKFSFTDFIITGAIDYFIIGLLIVLIKYL